MTLNQFKIAAIVLLAAASVGRAEVGDPHASGYSALNGGHRIHHPHVGFGYGYPGYGYHSSTAIEGIFRGRAAVIDAIGNFQVNAAEAAILREQARALDRQNDFEHILDFKARQELARKSREERRARRAVRVAEGEVVLAAREATVYQSAYRLGADEVNFATGEIDWPAVLLSDQFAEDRERLEAAVKSQAASGQSASAGDFAECVDSLSRALRNDIGCVDREDYIAGQKFLRGLEYAGAAGGTQLSAVGR